jgi:hypothetical protein
MFNDVSISLVTSIKRDFLLNINLLENFMKKLLLASLALVAMGAQAAVTTSPLVTTFSVSGSTTSGCQAATVGAGVGPAADVVFPAYTAFQGVVTSSSGPTIGVECTRDLSAAPTAVFDNDGAVGNKLATGGGTVAGLNYVLTAGTVATVPGSPSTASSIGTATNYSFTVSGSMPAGQAGSATASSPQARALIISW